MELRLLRAFFCSSFASFLSAVTFWILCVGWVHSLTNFEDVYGLNQLYTTLNAPILSGWSANGGDPCQDNWQGVFCAGANVTLLKLPGVGLAGTLSSALGNLTTLIVLDLSNNLLSGGLPLELPPHAQEIDLSGNQISGNLPFSLSSLINLATLNLSTNLLSGSLPDIFDQLQGLTNLDLSNNDFTSSLPQSIGELASLNQLYLQNNHFSGSLDALGDLSLTTLDVSNNNFTGWIPEGLKHIPSFKYSGDVFNMSPAPPPPLPLIPPPSSSESKHAISDDKTPSVVKKGQTSTIGGYLTIGRLVGIVIAGLFAIAVVAIIVLFFVWRTHHRDKNELDPEKSWDGPLIAAYKGDQQKNEQEPFKSVVSEISRLKPPPVETSFMEKNKGKGSKETGGHKMAIRAKAFSIAELQVATGSFNDEHLVGDGTLGKVYRANLSDVKVVAVKKLDYSISRVADEDFLQFLAKISHLRHPCIIELFGYCAEHGEHLLVYEFVGNGSLHENLHTQPERSQRLSWNTRLKIALGVAQALEYLHEVCKPPVLHGNVTSVNILLDYEFKPYLSDCGLATLVSLGEQHQASTGRLEFSGYSAPEYTKCGIYTALSDVYSFGVVMLELMTGRKALDSSKPRPEQFLTKWAARWPIHDIDALCNVVDPNLGGVNTPLSISKFAHVISDCLQDDPEFRPPMSEVVLQLQSITKLDR